MLKTSPSRIHFDYCPILGLRFTNFIKEDQDDYDDWELAPESRITNVYEWGLRK